jgi:hypothetical protein
MTIEDIKKKIDSIGNMKVIFEPTIYSENRIQKKDLQDVLEKTQVSMRGWSFPHIPREDRDDGKRPYSIGNGVEFYTSWQDMTEIFRLYQSGQFLAKFALREDTLGEVYGKKLEVGKYLDFLGFIYKVTEIVSFIKNLIDNTDIEGGRLTIEINKVMDRELESIFSQNIFSFNAGYICRMDKISITREFNKEKISNEPLEISREFIKAVFDDFNWRNYSDQMIQTHQANLLNRRI